MLSIFPDLLTFGLLAPFIIRLTLGIYFIYLVVLVIKEEHAHTFFELVRVVPAGVGGLLVLVGVYTQIGAIILVLWSLAEAIRAPKSRPISLFTLAMSLSLLFSGAGFFAFDLPL